MVATRRSTRDVQTPSTITTPASAFSPGTAISTKRTTPDSASSDKESEKAVENPVQMNSGLKRNSANVEYTGTGTYALNLKRRISEVYVEIPVRGISSNKKASIGGLSNYLLRDN